MEFIIDYLLPVFGHTVIGLAIIILILIIVVLFSVLVKLKDYKDIKANFLTLKDDMSSFWHSRNKRQRRKFGWTFVASIICALLVSAVLYSKKPIQMVITGPTEKTTINIEDETIITWKPIVGTAKYHVSIYPADKRIINGIEQYSFYVDGDEEGVKITIGNYIVGTGKYIISVSSDVENTTCDTIVVYLEYMSQID